MHTAPLQITNDQVVRAKDIVKIGKGVDKSSFVTGASVVVYWSDSLVIESLLIFALLFISAADGRAYEWNFESGIHAVKELDDLKVASLESGFHYRLLLAQPKKLDECFLLDNTNAVAFCFLRYNGVLLQGLLTLRY